MSVGREDSGWKPSAEAEYPIPIIRTKLHCPSAIEGLVSRVHHLHRWSADKNLSLVLISAPAGYGKTTLVSQWHAHFTGSSAWLSLDAEDNNLVRFAAYLIAALRTIFSDVCGQTLAALNVSSPIKPDQLAGLLCNELDEIGEPVVVVLDDYHQIHTSEIHEFMDRVLEYPPEGLQFIVITRRDPPFPLVSMRARGALREVRMRDLELSLEESKTQLIRETNGKINEELITTVSQRIEGWPVGLHLAGLALSQTTTPEELIGGFRGNLRDISDYLAIEIMSQLDPVTRNRLLKTSILDNFCAELCAQVWEDEGLAETQVPGAESFIETLQQRGMFCVSLDEHRKWFRFHRLFQEMLQEELSRQLSTKEIRALHGRASGWYEQAGLLEEAFIHANVGYGGAIAAEMIARNHIEIMNAERSNWVHSLLNMVPGETIDESPGLLVMKAQLAYQSFNYEKCDELLDRLEGLLPEQKPKTDEMRSLRGTIDVLRGGISAHRGNMVDSVVLIERSLQILPEQALVMRGLAIVNLVIVLCMTGKFKKAEQVTSSTLAETAPGDADSKFRIRALIAMGFLQWWRAEAHGFQLSGAAISGVGTGVFATESRTVGYFLEGVALYDRNKLDELVALFSPIVHSQVLNNVRYYTQCGFLLANAQNGLGLVDKARATAYSIVDLMRQNGQSRFLDEALAFEADLALRQGKLAQAAKWAESYESKLFLPIESYVSILTLIKQMISVGSVESLRQASAHLAKYEAHIRNSHNLRLLIDALAVKALMLEALGDSNDALETLAESVAYALPGGIVRTFIDLSHPMAMILHRLKVDDETLVFVGEVLAAIRGSADTSNAAIDIGEQPALDPLTKRELEILGLLAVRLTNREIAERLFISVGTVKRHTANIYQKLGTEGRRQTVAKARSTGLIRDASPTP